MNEFIYNVWKCVKIFVFLEFWIDSKIVKGIIFIKLKNKNDRLVLFVVDFIYYN